MSQLSGPRPDPRRLQEGRLIPCLNYCDQVYVIQTDDQAWLAVMTTGTGLEGNKGQHLLSLRSIDQGRSWTQTVALEPPTGPEASYAVLLKTPSGRIYAFYNHNTDQTTEVKKEDGGVFTRVDSLGSYVCKYTDDHGRTWSAQRYPLSIRPFALDQNNVYGGKIRFFWNVGRPFVKEGVAFLPHTKVGAFGHGFYAQSEGALLVSDNILTERDPKKIRWITRPDGDVGLRTPAGGGRIAEEQSVVPLSDGTLYCVYRSVDGWPVSAYSHDDGRTWTAPQYKTDEPSDRRFKHPRAANFVWKCANGRYLYWFHFHGGCEKARQDWSPYNDRNPAWLSAGHEIDTSEGKRLAWSQPEIVLYDDDPSIRISYPDLIEENAQLYLTSTQKNVARSHPIAPGLLENLYGQKDRSVVAGDGLLLERSDPLPSTLPLPRLPEFICRDLQRDDQPSVDLRTGLTFEFSCILNSLAPGQILLDSRNAQGGIQILTAENGVLKLSIADNRTENAWSSITGTIQPGKKQHFVLILDGGPKLILGIVDGVLQDGGDERQFGWGRFSPHLYHGNGAADLKIDSAVRLLRIYERALLVSEAVGNYRAQA
jgi:hypothetical protein